MAVIEPSTLDLRFQSGTHGPLNHGKIVFALKPINQTGLVSTCLTLNLKLKKYSFITNFKGRAFFSQKKLCLLILNYLDACGV